jgi:hypothetical protein
MATFRSTNSRSEGRGRRPEARCSRRPGVIVGISIPTNAQTVKVTDRTATVVIAQTNGMDRRQDRRDTRQDCRQENGAVGADKRNCKQQGRQN